MAKYPKKPKQPKSKSEAAWKRYDERMKRWEAAVKAINKPKNEIQKIKDKWSGKTATSIK